MDRQIRTLEELRDGIPPRRNIAYLFEELLEDPTQRSCLIILAGRIEKLRRENQAVKNFFKVFHDFLYYIEPETGAKYWTYRGKKHCDIKDENGHTLPAWINGDEKIWYFDGQPHRTDIDEDGFILPAKIMNNEMSWYVIGKLHRTGVDENGKVLPAYISNDTMAWYQNGKLHRTDCDENGTLPAFVNDRTKKWALNGKYHRTDRDENNKVLPAIISEDSEEWSYIFMRLENPDEIFNRPRPQSMQIWMCNDRFWRENKLPAVVASDRKYWCKKDRLHNHNAPAIVFNDGTRVWFHEGRQTNIIHGPAPQ